MPDVFVAANILDPATRTFGQALPKIGGAILLLVVGIPLAILLARIARRTLAALGIDRLGERFGIHDVLQRLGLQASLAHAVGRAVRIALILVVVVAALSLLGLGALSTALNSIVLFVPRLFVALAIVLVGVVAAEFVGKRTDEMADQMALGGPLRQLAQATILVLSVLIALGQLGIATGILIAMIAVFLAAVTLTLALSFGLGGRDVARELSAGRYLGGIFSLGQTISVGDIQGRIVSLDSAATTVRTEDGHTVRLPNHMLLDSIVTVHDEGATGTD